MEYRKNLKIISAVTVVMAVIQILLSVIIILTGSWLMSLSSDTAAINEVMANENAAAAIEQITEYIGGDASTSIFYLGVGFVVLSILLGIEALIYTAKGVVGIKLSGGSRLFAAAFVFGGIGLAVDIIALLFALVGMSGIFSRAVYVGCSAMYIACVRGLKQEADSQKLMQVLSDLKNTNNMNNMV